MEPARRVGLVDERDGWERGASLVRFPLFGFDVRVHLTFLILVVFVVDSGLSGASIALWLAAAFVSVLIHELGHAFTARRYGGSVQHITLYAMGGLTAWIPAPSMKGRHRFAVSAAGAGWGFVIAGLLWVAVDRGLFGRTAEVLIPTPWGAYLGSLDGFPLEFFVGSFLWVTIVWGAINWLPIGGLDGSHMLREVLRKVVGDSADLHAAIIGMAFAIGAGIVFSNWGYTFAPLLFIFFAGTDLMRVLSQRRS
jgi:Zn-dependent protease